MLSSPTMLDVRYTVHTCLLPLLESIASVEGEKAINLIGLR